MKKSNKKVFALAVALILVVVCAVGGTLAWLQDKTESVKNTFSTALVDIELTETTGEEYKMIPGVVLEKDPTVTVKGGSEDAYVFIKVDESTDLDTFLTYDLGTDWTAVDGEDGVYYTTYTASADDVEIAVLKDDQVTVNENVTNEQMSSLTEEPTLTFTAYAVQMKNGDANFDVAEAWEIAQNL